MWNDPVNNANTAQAANGAVNAPYLQMQQTYPLVRAEIMILRTRFVSSSKKSSRIFSPPAVSLYDDHLETLHHEWDICCLGSVGIFTRSRSGPATPYHKAKATSTYARYMRSTGPGLKT